MVGRVAGGRGRRNGGCLKVPLSPLFDALTGRLTSWSREWIAKDFILRGEVPGSSASLVAIGDSHAANWTPYISALGTALGRSASTDGIGGQQSVDISARQGGVPALVTVSGGYIPASGAVAVTILGGIRPLRGSGSISRPASIAGIAGTLSTTDGGVTYTFTRSTTGYAVPVPSSGVPLVMGSQHRDRLSILLAPRNDVGKNEAAGIWRAPLETILERYRRMTEWGAPDGKFLLLSILPWADEDAAGTAARIEANEALRDQHPQQWIDWAAWLRTDAAFAAAGVTKTSQDEADIAAGVTPATFRADEGHLNAAGYAAANALISLVITNQGW